jgi:hypothetical protein
MHVQVSAICLEQVFNFHQIEVGSAIEATNSCHLVVIRGNRSTPAATAQRRRATRRQWYS